MSAHTILRTTIEQHHGRHPKTGLREVRLVDVVTEGEAGPELEELHAAEVALAWLDAGPRERAEAIVASDTSANGYEETAAVIRRAIAQVSR